MKLALCMVMRNEERYIEEWIHYHAGIGIENFFIFDNASNDQSKERVRKMGKLYDVRLIEWPLTDSQYQILAYDHCVRNLHDNCDWIGFIDCDEFIYEAEEGRLMSCLSNNQANGGVALNWAIFGSSGQIMPTDDLVTQSFNFRALDTFRPNYHTKVFIQPSYFRGCLNPHIFNIDGIYSRPDGSPVDWESEGITTTVSLKDVRINHYFTKSYVEWERKIQRGYHDISRQMDVFHLYDRNEVEDRGMSRYSESLRKRISHFE